MKIKSFKALTLACSLSCLTLLGACGGGGGPAGTSVFDPNNTTSPTLGTSDANVTLTLSRSTLRPSQPITVVAVVENASGVPQVGKVVTFDVTNDLATVSPTTALTDSEGRATTTLTIGAVTSGADTVTATVTVDDETVVGSAGFQLEPAS